MNNYENANQLMIERFSRDSLISIATISKKRPYVRTVNAYYEDGAFYTVTNARSNKMKQIEKNPEAAVCGDWFAGHGVGENLGHVRDGRNAAMMAKLRKIFAAWYNNGHVNEDDKNTCLLRIRLTEGVLTDNEKKHDVWQYQVDFAKQKSK